MRIAILSLSLTLIFLAPFSAQAQSRAQSVVGDDGVNVVTLSQGGEIRFPEGLLSSIEMIDMANGQQNLLIVTDDLVAQAEPPVLVIRGDEGMDWIRFETPEGWEHIGVFQDEAKSHRPKRMFRKTLADGTVIEVNITSTLLIERLR